MKKDTIAIILLIALVLIFFAKVIISNEYFSGLDLVNAFYPWKSFLVQNVKSGELPLWNPYTFCGNPFIANFQACIFYPLDLIFYLTSVANAFRISLILHIILSGVWMYLLARYLKLNRTARIFAACVFMFNGFLFVRLSAGHSTMINGYAWIPLIFYLFLKGLENRKKIFIVYLALVLGIQLLCGHPQVPYYTLLSLLIYLIGYSIYQWRTAKNFRPILSSYIFYFAAVGIAAALAAIQILPAWQVAKLSATRAEGVQYEMAALASLSGKYLVMFFAPMSFGTSLDDTFWGGQEGFIEISGYLGILPILLMFYAWYRTYRTKQTRLFMLLFFISFILACGRHTPVYWLLYQVLPGFKLFRCPARWLMMVTFTTAIFSGIGLHQLIEHYTDKKELKRFLVFLAIIALVLLIIIMLLLIFRNNVINGLLHYEINTLKQYMGQGMSVAQIAAMIPDDAMENRFTMILNTLFKGFGLFLISGSVFYIFWRNKTVPRYLRLIPIILVLGDLWSFDVWFTTTDKAPKFYSNYYLDSAETQFLESDKSYYRILALDEVLSWMHTNETGPTAEFRPNRLMLKQIYDTRGYDPVTLRNYVGYINQMQGKSQRLYQGGLLYIHSIDKCNWEMLSRLNVKYIISVNEQVNPNLELVFQDHLKIYQNKTAVPRAYFISGKENESLIENKPPDAGSGSNQVAIVKYTANQIRVNVSTDTSGYLVLSEVDYPGWQVTVDRQKQTILTYRDIFRSVYLTPGEHQVAFMYAPQDFRWGMMISLISIFGCLGMLLTQLMVRKMKLHNKKG
ncbi:MAG: YfhO family protein [bacterium]